MAENKSFLPEDYLRKRLVRRTNLICLSLFVVVMSAVFGAFWVTGRRARDVRRQQQQVDARFVQAANRLDQLEKLRKKKQQMIHKAKVASVLVERVPRTLMLSEIINHMPATMSLLQMELKTKVLRHARRSLTAMQQASAKAKQADTRVRVPKTRMTLRMTGVAPTDVDVARFVSALINDPLFRDVNLDYSHQTLIKQQAMRKFVLTMHVHQDVDLRDIKPMMVKRKKLKTNPMADRDKITPPRRKTLDEIQAMPAMDRH